MKTIRCPYCQSAHDIGVGYHHDEKLNIRCNNCNKVMLATNEEDEAELTKLYARPVKESHEIYHNQSAMAAKQNAHDAYIPGSWGDGRMNVPPGLTADDYREYD